MTPGRADRGAASVWLVAVGAVVVTFGLAGAGLGTAVVGRHRAQAAADLGALAAAVHAIEGAGTACSHAGAIVTANGATLAACTLDGFDATVTAEIPVAGIGLARATARAGPAQTPGATDLPDTGHHDEHQPTAEPRPTQAAPATDALDETGGRSAVPGAKVIGGVGREVVGGAGRGVSGGG